MTKLALKWMPAKAFGGLFKRPAPAFVTVHSTESENTPAMAESLAGPGWFGGPKAGTSAHKIADIDSICEGVRRTNVAYAAGPGGNSQGIHYEFCGRASWSATRWREPAQLQMLRNAAPHIADDLIAVTGSRAAAVAAARWLSIVQVARNEHGLCTHNDIRLAKGGTTHTDPGPNFPYAELLAYVVAELGGSTAPALTPAQIEENELMSARTDILDAIAELRKLVDEVEPRTLQGRPAALIQDDVPGSSTRGTIWSIGPGGVIKLQSAAEAYAQQGAGIAGELVYIRPVAADPQAGPTVAEIAEATARLAALKRINGIPS